MSEDKNEKEKENDKEKEKEKKIENLHEKVTVKFPNKAKNLKELLG